MEALEVGDILEVNVHQFKYLIQVLRPAAVGATTIYARVIHVYKTVKGNNVVVVGYEGTFGTSKVKLYMRPVEEFYKALDKLEEYINLNSLKS